MAGVFFVRRGLGAAHPLVELRTLAKRDFAVGCLLSFVLGVGLFGSTYLMPVFLGSGAGGHNALEIGRIMLVTGVAQLLTAPAAVALEAPPGPEGRHRVRLCCSLPSASAWSVFGTPDTDFRGIFWPQVIRGVAIMFCLLPPTRLALGALALEEVPDASGLFNLMRAIWAAPSALRSSTR